MFFGSFISQKTVTLSSRAFHCVFCFHLHWASQRLAEGGSHGCGPRSIYFGPRVFRHPVAVDIVYITFKFWKAGLSVPQNCVMAGLLLLYYHSNIFGVFTRHIYTREPLRAWAQGITNTVKAITSYSWFVSKHIFFLLNLLLLLSLVRDKYMVLALPQLICAGIPKASSIKIYHKLACYHVSRCRHVEILDYTNYIR